jgi:amino acid transporter/mannitol/fructose-specific phosphotransferase system IIA component (Ntr-type)
MHKHKLGLWDVFSVASGAMISSGLFVLPGLAYALTGPSVILAYGLAAMLYLPCLLSMAELATAMPKSGGSYFFVERSLGALPGTIAGLINWLSISLKAAFALVGIGTIGLILFPEHGSLAMKAIAILACLLFTLINIFSVKGTGHLQGCLVAGLLGILSFYILAGLPHVHPMRYKPFFTAGGGQFLAVTGMIFISYGGLTKVVDIAGEINHPNVTLPMGMFLAFGVVNALYIMVLFVTVGVVLPENLAGSLAPISAGAVTFLGGKGNALVWLAAMLAYATTGNAGILSASRSPMAMSSDGLLPQALSRTNRFHTPHAAILLTSGFICIVIAFLSLEQLVKAASAMLLTSLVLVNVAVIVMRRSGIQTYRPTFRAPGNPWLPGATVLLYTLLILRMGLLPVLFAAGFILAGIVWYFTYVNLRIDQESMVIYMVKRILAKHITRIDTEDELRQIALERDEVDLDRFDHLVETCPVLDIHAASNEDELFQQLAEVLSPRLRESPENLLELFQARENESSTVIESGLAIPHIIIEGEHIFELVLVRCREGISFAAAPKPVHTAFVLLGSADERNYHLRALVAIAHVVQEQGFKQRWMEAQNIDQLRDIVLLSNRKREKKHAG